MIRQVLVENYKSIPKLTLDLGRVTVLIGENGSGKSNILEAIALASAASQNKLDNEFLASRGIRVTETRFMSSAFDKAPPARDGIRISVQADSETAFRCNLWADETASYPKWTDRETTRLHELFVQAIRIQFAELQANSPFSDQFAHLRPDQIAEQMATPKALTQLRTVMAGALPGFLIYAPENSALRTFQAEGQILPLGIRGEGLFAHLKGLSAEPHKARLEKIRETLTLIDWFEGLAIPDDLSPGERSIRIRDRFLPAESLFDQRSANEGFLFLLFYSTMLISPETPAFFAIDNIDTSLNPKLCIALLRRVATLAKEFDKQVILTTHNPAMLDGLDLHDDEQRLLVVDRNKEGHTRVRRVEPPKPFADRPAVSLSEAFMRGYIGGLPNNF